MQRKPFRYVKNYNVDAELIIIASEIYLIKGISISNS